MNYRDLDVYKSYASSPFLSIKHSNYFGVYSEILEKFRNKPIIFVEVGVYNGGSLFMWRDFLGPKARIIGVEFNPLAKKLEEHGFEIFIGNQADPDFWTSFFKQIGPVDVVLDDGGHTNEQQIVTASICFNNINNGGIMIVEDTHSSYMTRFGNPSRYSFIEWTKTIVDDINYRSSELNINSRFYKDVIYSVNFHESIVCFNIDRIKSLKGLPTTNSGKSSPVEDFRYKDSILDRIRLKSRLVFFLVMWVKSFKLKKYF